MCHASRTEPSSQPLRGQSQGAAHQAYVGKPAIGPATRPCPRRRRAERARHQECHMAHNQGQPKPPTPKKNRGQAHTRHKQGGAKRLRPRPDQTPRPRIHRPGTGPTQARPPRSQDQEPTGPSATNAPRAPVRPLPTHRHPAPSPAVAPARPGEATSHRHPYCA